MSAIHFHYDQLTDLERARLDDAFKLLTDALKTEGIPFHGGDPIEIAVDATAAAILAVRPEARSAAAESAGWERTRVGNTPEPEDDDAPTSSAEIEAILSEPAQPQPRTVDITPVGMKTPEGAQRVAAALEVWNSSAHEVANKAQEWMRAQENGTATAYDLEELQDAIDERTAKQEEFLRAVAGAPPAKTDQWTCQTCNKQMESDAALDHAVTVHGFFTPSDMPK